MTIVVPERKGSRCVLFCWSEGSRRNKNVTATERVSSDNRVRAHDGVKRERTLVSEEGLKCRFCDFYQTFQVGFLNNRLEKVGFVYNTTTVSLYYGFPSCLNNRLEKVGFIYDIATTSLYYGFPSQFFKNLTLKRDSIPFFALVTSLGMVVTLQATIFFINNKTQYLQSLSFGWCKHYKPKISVLIASYQYIYIYICCIL